MKSIFKKILKIMLVFIISTITIYCMLTMIKFYNWCEENQILLSTKDGFSEEHINNLKQYKIDYLGKYIRNYEKLGEYSGDSLGYSIWAYMQTGIGMVFEWFRELSILLGLAITIGYIIITNQKITPVFKVILGYLGVILSMLPLTYFIYHSPGEKVAHQGENMLWFYLIYTVVFFIMYIMNYRNEEKSKLK